MNRNTIGGKKHKRAKNKVHTKLILADNEQYYAVINRKLGGGRFDTDVVIPESSKKSQYVKSNQIAIRRGRIKRSTRLNAGCIVLVTLRNFEDKFVDIIHCYKSDEIYKLKNHSSFPKSAVFQNDNNDIEFEFEKKEENDNSKKQIQQNTPYINNFDLIPASDSDLENSSKSDSESGTET